MRNELGPLRQVEVICSTAMPIDFALRRPSPTYEVEYSNKYKPEPYMPEPCGWCNSWKPNPGNCEKCGGP